MTEIVLKICFSLIIRPAAPGEQHNNEGIVVNYTKGSKRFAREKAKIAANRFFQ